MSTGAGMEMLPAELETLDLSQQAVDRAIAEAEGHVELLNRLMQIALKRTLQQDWVDFSGRPYLTAAGAERLRPLFGITITDADPKRYEDRDERGSYYYFVVTGTAHFRGDHLTVMGTCSARDPFFSVRYERKNGEREQVLLPASEVDPTNIVKAAYSNMLVNAVTRVLGIRGLTWEDLERLGFDRTRAARVQFKDKSQPPGQTPSKASDAPPDGKSWVTALATALQPYVDTESERDDLLRKITAFERRDGSKFAGHTWDSLQRSKNAERAAQVAYGKLRALIEQDAVTPKAPPAAAPPDNVPL